MTDATERCPCGRPLHYGDPAIRRLVDGFVAALGPTLRVTVGGQTWLVARHYIALHGLRGAEVASLGFPEVTA